MDDLNYKLLWRGAVFLIVLIAVGAASAQPRFDASTRQKIRDYLDARQSRGEFSGTVAIRLNGRDVYRQSAGKADYELNAQFTPATKFRLASLTKSFTAAAISILLKEGTLKLDDRLSKFLPEFPNAESITVRHLLSHASGIGEADPITDPSQKFTLREAIERFRLKQPYFAPGTSDRYSNEGYTLLAFIVESVSGMSYSDFLQANIFNPLQLRDTGNFESSEIVPHRARGYLPGPPPAMVVNAFPNDLSAYLGAGSIYSTSDDLLRWLEATRTERLYQISQQTYPYGWGRRNYFNRKALEQTGLYNGFGSAILTFPAEKLDIVCLLNVQTGFFNSCAKDIAAIVLGAPYKSPEKVQYVPIAHAQTEKFLGTYQARPDLGLRILRDGKDLYYCFINNCKERFFLGTLSTSELFNLTESARMKAVSIVGGRVQEIEWISPIDTLRFKRVE